MAFGSIKTNCHEIAIIGRGEADLIWRLDLHNEAVIHISMNEEALKTHCN